MCKFVTNTKCLYHRLGLKDQLMCIDVTAPLVRLLLCLVTILFLVDVGIKNLKYRQLKLSFLYKKYITIHMNPTHKPNQFVPSVLA